MPFTSNLDMYKAYQIINKFTLLTILFLMSCASAPTQEMSNARQALQAARDAGAVKNAPSQLKKAEALMLSAEQALNAGEDTFSTARGNARLAKGEAIKARKLALAIAAAKTAIAEAVAEGVLSDEAENALRNAVTEEKQGNDTKALEHAENAKKLAENAIANLP